MPFPSYATEAEIPADVRDEYEEAKDAPDGKPWRPKRPDTSGLTSALASERDRAEKAEKARKDAEKRAQELERQRTASASGITDEQLQKLRDEDEKKRRDELEPLQSENGTLKEKLRRYELEEPVRKLFGVGTDGGMFVEDWDDVPGVRTALLARFGTTADGTTLVVLDAKGQPTTQQPAEFVAEYRKQFPRRFNADVGSGTGATRQPGGGGAAKDAHEAARERQRRSGAYAPM